MAIFSSEENNIQGSETIIGASVKVDGNFRSDGNVTVDGEVQGSLKTNHDLTVGPNARIKAEVEAKNLILSGVIKGNIKIREKTQLNKSARINGNLETKILTVEEGAILNGKCTMIIEQTPIPEIKKQGK